MTHPTVTDRLAMRERARALGDRGLERACNADLSRYGYDEMETTAVAAPERAVPARKRPRDAGREA